MTFYNPVAEEFYNYIEYNKVQRTPFRQLLQHGMEMLKGQDDMISRYYRAAMSVAERMTRHYTKPWFNIKQITIANGKTAAKEYDVKEEALVVKTFCQLRHFSIPDLKEKRESILLIAPIAGHYATLLRETVKSLLPLVNVYITDWASASAVPVERGTFDLDDQIDYISDFIRFLHKKHGRVHAMAVCQPTVALLAAVSFMAQNNDPATPKSMIMVGGPIDARRNPTKLNIFTEGKTIDWFKRNVITKVPPSYPGAGRRVYSGIMQLTAFMGLNMKRHLDAHLDLFNFMVHDDKEKIAKHTNFYDEYFAVMDLTEEFYLQTIQRVFLDYDIAQNRFMSRGRLMDARAIKNCRIFGIEGELDDIAGLGQTKAVFDICCNVPESYKRYHMQPKVGHYGVFSGSAFHKNIAPQIHDFISKS
ncbi:Polyhydroxyalkanoate depolymerase [Rickettsiales endosymbiont of Paramecium tredecaurelia]|uniref:polyhydroxyalkanoate depolymerase n=1 Tax=Candidatus Sarmatiella mevalonica TaxID=2770581 RepID=UPI0019240638|nr:polyhydroxyalkanoate depolymerase [Candidatus Sarmatiella mevalonica]MBL3285006.1 Polyhydroxyalkanoate depolymerase [Candidatus Sarmatiella mevalonica]